jgi:hypothetical protein
MTIKFTKGNINPTTKKFPRTLAEAFPKAPEANFDRPFDKEDKLVIVACIVIGVLVFGSILLGVI